MAQEIDQTPTSEDYQMGETIGAFAISGTSGSDRHQLGYGGGFVNLRPKLKIGIIIQARTTSSRFPNKVLADFGGMPIIERVIKNLRPLDIPIIVSIPTAHSNDVLYDFITSHELAGVHRSKWEHDVLSRFKECIAIYEYDIIIRICADCPLIKDSDVNFMLNKFLAEGGTRMVWGLGCWIFTKEMLEDVERNSVHAQDREHCGFYYMSKSVDWPDDIERLVK
jgi:spore coat polysaccharide biosynthesis protein SpsF (cytidylyltransferase family)